MLQDAQSEVTKIYPPLKLRVFVDGITALLMEKDKLMGVNREVAEAAKKVMKRPREEAEEKGLKLSVNENWKVRKEQDDCFVRFLGG